MFSIQKVDKNVKQDDKVYAYTTENDKLTNQKEEQKLHSSVLSVHFIYFMQT